MSDASTPTSETYNSILQAYEFFNQALFHGHLPKVIVAYQRQRRVMGYTSIGRWVNAESTCVDELGVNPEYFAKYPLLELCQTLCHEMVHIWQAHFGRPGRRGYHNIEWAKKMQSIGLMPSATGKPGGDITGETMMDYILVEGPFLEQCRALIDTGYKLPWVDRYPVFRHEVPLLAFTQDAEPIELDPNYHPKKTQQKARLSARTAARDDTYTLEDPSMLFESDHAFGSDMDELYPLLETKKATRSDGRVKYACPVCHLQVWGRPKLNIGCLDCGVPLKQVT